jgi:hypothetical protein
VVEVGEAVAEGGVAVVEVLAVETAGLLVFTRIPILRVGSRGILCGVTNRQNKRAPVHRAQPSGALASFSCCYFGILRR